MKKIDIKGKEYIEVHERLKEFRSNEDYKGMSLTADIISNDNGTCIIKAIITNSEGVIVATGHACEKDGSSFINKTSYIENCETSAWGRALGNLGIGIDTSVASYDEVANAVKQQKKIPQGQVGHKGYSKPEFNATNLQNMKNNFAVLSLEHTTGDELIKYAFETYKISKYFQSQIRDLYTDLSLAGAV